MMYYKISEHFGRRIRKTTIVAAEHPNDALLFAAGRPFLVPADADGWNYIDDGLGGGALIDPNDEDHCLRADPLGKTDEGEDYTTENDES